MRKAYGFTIVELLIVIVVIGILAAISIVAYNGISNNANDTAVKNDLANFAKQIQMFHAENGHYPAGGVLRLDSATSAPGSSHQNIEPGVKFSATKSSHSQPTVGGSANFIYCTGPDAGSGEPGFAILTQSMSGNMYKHSSSDGLQLTGSRSTSMGVGLAAACAGYDYPRSYSYGFSVGSGWSSWAQ